MDGQGSTGRPAGSQRVTRDVGSIDWPASRFDPGCMLRRASQAWRVWISYEGDHRDIKPWLNLILGLVLFS